MGGFSQFRGVLIAYHGAQAGHVHKRTVKVFPHFVPVRGYPGCAVLPEGIHAVGKQVEALEKVIGDAIQYGHNALTGDRIEDKVAEYAAEIRELLGVSE